MPSRTPWAVGRMSAIRVALTVLTLSLAGCGVETAGTAATIGVSQTQEIEQGREVQKQVQQQMQKSAEQAQQRADPLANGY